MFLEGGGEHLYDFPPSVNLQVLHVNVELSRIILTLKKPCM